MSQTTEILRHLQNRGSITPLDALADYGCFRLGARIHELKALGYRIKTTLVRSRGKHFARYTLERR